MNEIIARHPEFKLPVFKKDATVCLLGKYSLCQDVNCKDNSFEDCDKNFEESAKYYSQWMLGNLSSSAVKNVDEYKEAFEQWNRFMDSREKESA